MDSEIATQPNNNSYLYEIINGELVKKEGEPYIFIGLILSLHDYYKSKYNKSHISECEIYNETVHINMCNAILFEKDILFKTIDGQDFDMVSIKYGTSNTLIQKDYLYDYNINKNGTYDILKIRTIYGNFNIILGNNEKI